MKKVLGFLFSASLGALYGIFFAQKSGTELRKNLKKSKSPTKDLMKELKEVAYESAKRQKRWQKIQKN